MTHDHVTFATAILLKDAGFQQPAPAPGQFWYNKYEDIICWGHTVDSWGEPYEDATTFAPTATDILRELNFHHLRPLFGHKWAIHNHYELGDSFEICTNENPAEAAAEAWLKLNEK